MILADWSDGKKACFDVCHDCSISANPWLGFVRLSLRCSQTPLIEDVWNDSLVKAFTHWLMLTKSNWVSRYMYKICFQCFSAEELTLTWWRLEPENCQFTQSPSFLLHIQTSLKVGKSQSIWPPESKEASDINSTFIQISFIFLKPICLKEQGHSLKNTLINGCCKVFSSSDFRKPKFKDYPQLLFKRMF